MIFWAIRIENRARLTHFSSKMAIFGKYLQLHVDNVDEIFIRIRIFLNMRIIRMNRILMVISNRNTPCDHT